MVTPNLHVNLSRKSHAHRRLRREVRGHCAPPPPKFCQCIYLAKFEQYLGKIKTNSGKLQVEFRQYLFFFACHLSTVTCRSSCTLPYKYWDKRIYNFGCTGKKRCTSPPHPPQKKMSGSHMPIWPCKAIFTHKKGM